jgi:hypothetical protein
VADTEADQPVGPLLDALGVTIELEANQHLTEAIVLGKVIDLDDNTTGLVIGSSNSLDWIAQRGLVAAAQHILDHDGCRDDDD